MRALAAISISLGIALLVTLTVAPSIYKIMTREDEHIRNFPPTETRSYVIFYDVKLKAIVVTSQIADEWCRVDRRHFSDSVDGYNVRCFRPKPEGM